MKPGPIIAMAALLVLGFWLAAGPSIMSARVHATPGATVSTLDLGSRKIVYERVDDGSAATHRFLTRSEDLPSEAMSAAEFWSEVERIERDAGRRHWALRAFNISNWWNLGWIAVGLGGQMAFFGRMLVQWVASEREKRSVVPALFWWLSLAGGVSLFAYFVWRRDVVGVLGQSTGVVIYARNIRLIVKARRRERRDAARAEELALSREDPAGEPVL